MKKQNQSTNRRLRILRRTSIALITINLVLIVLNGTIGEPGWLVIAIVFGIATALLTVHERIRKNSTR